MKTIENEKQYQEAVSKIDQLLAKLGGDENFENPEVVMLDRLSDLVADYEDQHYKIEKPTLLDVIKLRMYEMGLKQEELAELLNVPKSRMSEYLRGKRNITLDVAKNCTHN